MQEQLIDHILDKFRNWPGFPTTEKVTDRFRIFDLEYDQQSDGLRALECFAEGSFTIGPLKITREYVQVGCFPKDTARGEGDKVTLYTRVENTEKAPTS